LFSYRNSKDEAEFFINLKDIKKGENSPLHWSIYWLDIHLTNLVFDQCKEQIFWMNSKGEVPFDMSNYSKTKHEEDKA
jgi:hypothetical protein